MAIMMPGTTRRINPITVKIVTTIWAINKNGSLDITNLKLPPRFEEPVAIRSEAYLMAIAVAGVRTINDTRPIKVDMVIKVEMKSKSHENNSSSEAYVCGGDGRVKWDCIALVDTPIITPEIRNGKKNCRKRKR
jgi:hypothetical protein